MSMNHDFFLIKKIKISEYRSYLKYFQQDDYISLDDILFRNLNGFKLIKTYNPNKNCNSNGFNYYGESIIFQSNEIKQFLNIVISYISLYTLAKEEIELIDGYDPDNLKTIKISKPKEIVLKKILDLKELVEQAIKENLSIYHRGI